ncbi:MAG TPA: SCO family protein [Bryobacteraceae bacterium]|nr:SCO family protein [Bryobacteraceae bacterium]
MTCRALCFPWLFVLLSSAASVHEYQATGLVLTVDAPHRTVLVSHDPIPGYMDAMTMPYRVHNPRELDNLKPGEKIAFTLVVGKTRSYITHVQVREYNSMERDPAQTRRLSILDEAMRSKSTSTLSHGQTVPDFSLVDQTNHPVPLSEFRGKVVAITFIYTRCPLPDYCMRLTNNFARLQQRFGDRMGRDLVLLSVSFDPDHDQPDVLANYAAQWKANVAGWHFLTGKLSDVKQVCGMFGMNFWPDEGLMTHSLHTAVIDRAGKLAANIEGNQYTAVQLGDLIEATLK